MSNWPKARIMTNIVDCDLNRSASARPFKLVFNRATAAHRSRCSLRFENKLSLARSEATKNLVDEATPARDCFALLATTEFTKVFCDIITQT